MCWGGKTESTTSPITYPSPTNHYPAKRAPVPAYERIVGATLAVARCRERTDIDAIERLLHADYVIVQPGGRIETKAEVLASYRTDRRHWNIAEVDRSNIRGRESTARARGRGHASGRHGTSDLTTQLASSHLDQTG